MSEPGCTVRLNACLTGSSLWASCPWEYSSALLSPTLHSHVDERIMVYHSQAARMVEEHA